MRCLSGLYPTELIDVWWLDAGARVLVRPVLPQDAPLWQAFVRQLSPESRYQRFMSGLNELTPAMLAYLTQVDYCDHLALVAEIRLPAGDPEQIGEARYVRSAHGAPVCDFAIAVADAWQGKGIGRRLLRSLRERAREAGFSRMRGEVLAQNRAMLGLARAEGLRARPHPEEARLVLVEDELDGAPAWDAPGAYRCAAPNAGPARL